METLKKEIDHVIQSDYRLDFTIPTESQLHEMRRIHRERTAAERDQVVRAEKDLRSVLRSLEDDVIDPEDLSPDLRKALWEHLRIDRGTGNDSSEDAR